MWGKKLLKMSLIDFDKIRAQSKHLDPDLQHGKGKHAITQTQRLTWLKLILDVVVDPDPAGSAIMWRIGLRQPVRPHLVGEGVPEGPEPVLDQLLKLAGLEVLQKLLQVGARCLGPRTNRHSSAIYTSSHLRTSVGDPDPYIFWTPGSGSVGQRNGSGSFYHLAKTARKTLIPTFFAGLEVQYFWTKNIKLRNIQKTSLVKSID